EGLVADLFQIVLDLDRCLFRYTNCHILNLDLAQSFLFNLGVTLSSSWTSRAILHRGARFVAQKHIGPLALEWPLQFSPQSLVAPQERFLTRLDHSRVPLILKLSGDVFLPCRL